MDDFEHWSGSLVGLMLSTGKSATKEDAEVKLLFDTEEQKEVPMELNQLWAAQWT